MTRWVVVVGLVALAGCLQNNLTPCGDQFCPAGKQCHEPTSGCFGPDQIKACEGKADFDACEFGPFTGFCLDGICLAPRCGDGFMQPEIGEACDNGQAMNTNEPNAECRPDCQFANCGDGIVDSIREEICDEGMMNGQPGSMCALGCGSDNTCGNGIVDFGEDCDDANDLVRDGCSGCRAEQFVSQQLAGASPRARINAAIAYDAARERVVIFGGRSPVGGFRKDTLEWDGARWRDRRPLVAPSGREAAVAVYDPKRHRIVLFGGDDGTRRDDLWEFDGAIWTEITQPATRPVARRGHAMAYDPSRGQIVLFGGKDANDVRLGDTWLWNGTTWTEVTQSDGPPPTENVAMTYDARNNRVVMFGGLTDAGLDNKTWFWNGTWTLATTTGVTMPARQDVNLVYEASRSRVVAVGASNGPGTFSNTQVFELDDLNWVQIPNSFAFSNDGPSVAYDAARRQLVGVITQFNTTGTVVRNVGSPVWAFSNPGPTPPGRVHAGAAYDARRGRVVMFGGQNEDLSSAPVETWEWDGSRWSVSLAGGPVEHVRPAMAFSNKDGIVMVGGRSDGNNADTWRWTGSAWQQLDALNPLLGIRFTAGFAYDQKRDRLVLHGGHFQDNLDATFEWNGAWSQLAPAQSAGERHNFAMAYDPFRERTMAIGGHALSGAIPTAFEFDGTAWTSIQEPGGQFARGSRLIFDPNARKLVYLFDPEDTGFQVWDYDGTWRQRDPSPPLPPLYRPIVVFDAVRSEIVIFGGRGGAPGSPINNSTTVLAFQPNAAIEACTSSLIDYDNDQLAGCADPDCAARCTPTCTPGTTCAVPSTTCGDNLCNAPLEDCKLCPGDCGICGTSDCGDFHCAGTETSDTCPADCGPPAS